MHREETIWLILVLFLIVNVGYHTRPTMGQSLQLDLFTQKFPYDGRGINKSSDAFSYLEEVKLYAYVDYNGLPVANVLVVYQVGGPLDISYISVKETNSSGIAVFGFTVPNNETNAFGEWSALGRVQVAGIVAEDRVYFKVGFIVNIVSVTTVDDALRPKTEFSLGNVLGVNVVVENIGFVSKNVTVVAMAEDEMGLIIDNVQQGYFEAPSGKSSLQLSLRIPEDVAAGKAKVHVSALTAPLEQGGIPYSPEVTASFLIVLHDVAVVSVVPSKTDIEAGQRIDIIVTIKNEGSKPESFEASVSNNRTLLKTFQVYSLEPGTFVYLNFSWNTTGLLAGIHVISASVSPVQGELDTDDNYAETSVIITSPPSPPPPDGGPPGFPTPTLIPTWLIGLLAILVLFITLLIAMFLYRRKKRREYSESFERAWKAWYDGLNRG